MTPERWERTNRYAREVFAREPEELARLREDADAAGIPAWAVTPEVGRFLQVLAATTLGQTALEIGTLAGYSTAWIVRGLQPDGRIITLEYEDRHADFAEAQFQQLGIADRVELRRGTALDHLGDIADQVGPKSLDFVFIDADKESYPAYWNATRDLMTPGGLIVADNVFGTGSAWIDDISDPGMAAIDRMNRMAAEDPDYDVAGVFMRSGLMVARRKG